MGNRPKFEWNREIILGGKTYGINDSKKEIRSIYKTKEEQIKEDRIKPFEAVEAIENGEGHFFKNPYVVTQEELVNWAFYGRIEPVQDFFIAFNTIENIPLMVDLIELKDSQVTESILYALYETTSRFKNYHLKDDDYDELKKIVKKIEKENRSEVIQKWMIDLKEQIKML